VLAWVNDGSTLRAYESANDAYAVFRKMMKRGKPSLGPLRQLLNSRKARRAGGNAGQSTRYFPQNLQTARKLIVFEAPAARNASRRRGA
jgi:hypothetical protein